MSTICVGRELELIRLKGFLSKTLSGNFQICFVTGEAGSGKTTLLNGFTTIIDEIAPDAIVAFGECDAQTGISDPYLPFKEVLSILIGDIESSKSQGRLTSGTAKNLSKFAAISIEALLEIGPDLIGSIVPGGALIARAVKAFSDKSEIIKKIKNRLDNPINTEINQSTIFQEYTNVLISLSKKRPLIIFLDDLHWVDNASSALLFHLSRKLSSSKIMIVGTYRPNEIYTLINGLRHPMETMINETKRYFGDIRIDLDEYSKNKGIDFVNALIDSEPNKLTNKFRTHLYSLTEGNALFTSELLRNLKEKGDLVLDSQERWIEKASLNWQEIPPKVEGVIQERISRLEKELREALSIASVEGENFTAQVIGSLQSLSDRLVLHELSDELEKRHRLVAVNGELKVGTNFLSYFRFSHSLIHQYLYNELGISERRILHKQVAQTLELLYKNQIDLISTQLARHYEEAGETEKAIYYLGFVANKAARISAFKDAKSLLEKALRLGTSEAATLIIIHLQLGIVFYGMGDYPSALTHLESSLIQAQATDNQMEIANCKLYLSQVFSETGEFEQAEKQARDCIDIAKLSKQDDLLIKGYSQLGYVMYTIGDVDQAVKFLERSLELESKIEKKLGHVWKVHLLYTLGCCEIVLNNLTKAEEFFVEDIQVAQTIGNREVESYSVTDLGFVVYEKGEYERAKKLFEQGLALGLDIDAQWTIAEARCGLGFVNAILGNFAEAKVHLQSALKIFDATKTFTGLLLTIVGFAQLLNKQNEYNEALHLIGLSRKYSTPIADTDHFSDLVLNDIRLKISEELILQEIEKGKILNMENTITRLIEN